MISWLSEAADISGTSPLNKVSLYVIKCSAESDPT